MKLYDLIDKYPNKTPKQIARMALTEDPNGVLTVVANEVERARRDATRSSERTNIAPLFAGQPPTPKMLAGLCASFRPSQGAELVPWGKATVDEHRQRIAFLNLHIAGTVRTRTYHETAIVQIEAAGVACLDELYAEGAA